LHTAPPEQYVNRQFTPAELARFCSIAIQAGFDASPRGWMSGWHVPGTSRSYAKEAFMEAASRCV